MKRNPFILYHWSPTERRKSISRRGMLVGQKCVQHSQEFPYLCWSDSPSLAWGLSGALSDTEGLWDLWMVWSDRLGRLTKRKDLQNVSWHPTEYRNRQNVSKKDLWLVATKLHKPKGKKKQGHQVMEGKRQITKASICKMKP